MGWTYVVEGVGVGRGLALVEVACYGGESPMRFGGGGGGHWGEDRERVGYGFFWMKGVR